MDDLEKHFLLKMFYSRNWFISMYKKICKNLLKNRFLLEMIDLVVKLFQFLSLLVFNDNIYFYVLSH